MMRSGRVGLFILSWIFLTLAWAGALIEITTLVSYHNCFTAGEMFAWVTANGYEVSDIAGYCLRYVWPYWAICSLIYIGLCWGVWRCVRSERKCAHVVAYLLPVCLLIPFVAPFVSHNLLAEVLCVRHQIQTIQENKGDNVGFSYGASRTDSIEGKEVYVLSIGESLRYKNVSLNGEYERETMPLLAKQDGLCLFSNCYANATLTQHALPMLLCGVDAAHFTEHYSQKTIAVAFAEVGFRTALVSHRAQLMNTGYHNYLAADFDTIIMVQHDSLIAPAMEALCEKENKLFVVTHYLGNHMFYTNIDGEDLIWRPDYNADRGVRNDSLFLNAYDNSIRYTDKMLAREIEVLKKQDGVCAWLFVSDHGEYISERVSGHGHTYKPAKEEYHVPMMVWTNRMYLEIGHDRYADIVMHKDDAISSEYAFDAMLELVGINIKNRVQPQERQLLLPDGKTIMRL